MTHISRTRAAGGIVLGDNGTLAMVRSQNSKSWLFPKGHVDPGETDEQTALREVKEETGLTNLEYIDDLGTFIRPRAGDPSEEKEVHMFLFAAPPHATLTPTMEIEEARWVSLKETLDTLGTPHPEWFAADRAWFVSVFERVRQAVQRD